MKGHIELKIWLKFDFNMVTSSLAVTLETFYLNSLLAFLLVLELCYSQWRQEGGARGDEGRYSVASSMMSFVIQKKPA